MCDLIVAGAGIIGASIAWRAAQAGLRVALCDAGSAGSEASWAGAGMLAPGGEAEKPGIWTRLALESLREYPGFVAELQSESGVEIDYRRTGAVEIAVDEEAWARLRARAEIQRSAGIPYSPVDRAQARELVFGDSSHLIGGEFAGALYYPEDACVDPRDVNAALMAACSRREVRLHEGCRVISLESSADSVMAVTECGSFAAGSAVIAAGAWSARIQVRINGCPGTLPRSFPVRGHLLGYWLAAGSIRTILREGHTYVLQRANGFTIAGTSIESAGFDRRIDGTVVADIERRATGLAPLLKSAGPADPWIGFRPAVEGDPRIERLPESRIWLAYGHYRNGILLAPATAGRITRELSGIRAYERSGGTDA